MFAARLAFLSRALCSPARAFRDCCSGMVSACCLVQSTWAATAPDATPYMVLPWTLQTNPLGIGTKQSRPGPRPTTRAPLCSRCSPSGRVWTVWAPPCAQTNCWSVSPRGREPSTPPSCHWRAARGWRLPAPWRRFAIGLAAGGCHHWRGRRILELLEQHILVHISSSSLVSRWANSCCTAFDAFLLRVALALAVLVLPPDGCDAGVHVRLRLGDAQMRPDLRHPDT